MSSDLIAVSDASGVLPQPVAPSGAMERYIAAMT
jgi:hypothetical protein